MFQVNVTTGVLCEEATDLEISSPLPLEIVRRYSSADRNIAGRFAFGWTDPFGKSLDLRGDAVVYSAGGRGELAFGPIGPGQTVTDDQRGWTLSRSNEYFVLTNARYHFVFGALHPNASTFLLTETWDYYNNWIRCEYAEDGRLAALADCDGRRIDVASDTSQRITGLSAIVHRGEAPIWLATYEYDRSGDLRAHTDAQGNRTEYEYSNHLLVAARYGDVESFAAFDARGRCIKKWLSGGMVVRSYAYDDRNRATLETNSDGATILYRYNEKGLVEEEIAATGTRERTHYDPSGSLIATVDDAGATLEAWVKDDANRSLSHTDASGKTVVFSAQTPEKIVISSSSGERWEHVLDGSGLEIKEISPTGSETQFEYDGRGRVKKVIGPTGHVVTNEWSDDSRSLVVRDELGIVTEAFFDFFGQLREERGRGGARTRYTYDLAGRPIEVETATGQIVRYEWTSDGAVRQTQIGSERPRRFEYNRAGFCVSYPSGRGEQIRVDLDAEGRTRRLVNAKNEEWQFEYDLSGRLTQQRFFDGRIDRYEYDAAGALTRMEENGGRVSWFLYNSDGRLQEAHDSERNVVRFEYDQDGRTTATEANEIKIAYRYTELGLLAREEQNGRTLTFEYDSNGNAARVLLDEREFATYRYDDRDLLVSMTDRTRNTYRFEYTSDGLRSACLYPNGLVRRYEYDAQGRIVGSQFELGGKILVVQRYAYNDAGRIVTSRDPAGRSLEYDYDDEGRLVSVRSESGRLETYVYDIAGNLTSIDGVANLQYERGGRLVRAGDVSLEYDADGRVVDLRKPDAAFSFRYGAGGVITEAVNARGARARYDYDALDRLMAVTTEKFQRRFTWLNGAIAAVVTQRSHESTEEIFVDDPAADNLLAIHRADGVIIYPVCDHRGVIVASFDSEGRLTAEPPLTSYGSSRGPSTSPFRLPGQFTDDFSALYYNRYRFYVPELARYLTPDPLGIEGGVLPYSYPTDPISEADPLGLAWTVISCADVRAHEAANKTQNYTRISKNPNVQKAFENHDQAARDSNRWSKPTEECDAKKLHEQCINHLAKKRKAEGTWSDRRADRGMRKAPQTPGTNPPRAGRNRPDWQGTSASNVRHYCEIDNPSYVRMRGHIARTCANDPNGMIELFAIPKKKKKRASMDEKCGMAGEPMKFADFERDYIKPTRAQTYARRFYSQ